MLRTVLFLLTVCILSGFSTFAHADDREDECGWSFPVSSYSAKIAGISIDLPSMNQLRINGKMVMNGSPAPWGDSMNTARIGLAGDDILVLASWTDCVDEDGSHVYVIDRTGHLRAQSDVWTQNSNDGFVREDKDIIYWSEWFCSPENKELKPGKSYVYLLVDHTGIFVRQDRSYAELCSAEAKTRLRANSVSFRLMKPN